MSELTIEVSRREASGKNVNRRLRSSGQVPAVVYGGGREPVPIQLHRRTLLELMRSTEGHNPIFLLQLADTGKSRHAMIRDMQVDPISRQVLHVDFQRILMTEKIRVSVDLELAGTPVGVRTEGGMLDFVTRSVEIECLPDRIPTKLTLDVGELHVGQHIEASALTLPEGVELLDEPSRVIAAISILRAAEAVEGEEEEEAELLIETPSAEPEVMRRGKVDEDEEG